MKKLVVTGGLGFIGSEFVKLARLHNIAETICVIDCVTYAARREAIEDVSGVKLVKEDIRNSYAIQDVCYGADAIVNFAAETHVDNSISDARSFVETNIFGVYTLAEYVKEKGIRLVQVSTDEVYGCTMQPVAETSPFNPSSPYAASKASAELLLQAYHKTHGIDVVVTRGCNTYGPLQHHEKFIPRMTMLAVMEKSLPIFGSGEQEREWIDVRDHCLGIEAALLKGVPGEAYNLGSGWHLKNIDVAMMIKELAGSESEIRHEKDRKAHDFKYSVDSSKALNDLGWKPIYTHETGLHGVISQIVESNYTRRPGMLRVPLIESIRHTSSSEYR